MDRERSGQIRTDQDEPTERVPSHAEQPRITMTNRTNNTTSASFATVAAGATTVFLAGILAGCGGDPPPPPPPPVVQAAPAEPEAPPVTPIKELMARFDIDSRVNLPEDRAPSTDEQRIAVLKFFDAFARGNADGLRSMLSGPDQLQLDGLVAGDLFRKTTASVTRIDVRCGQADSDACALAVFHVGEDFQPQLWKYTVGDKPEFDSIATPPNMMSKLSGNDWIAAWNEVLKLELAKADEPDVVIEIPQSDLTTRPTVNSSSTPGGASPISPIGAPGGDEPASPDPGDSPGRPKKPGFGR